MTAVIATIDAMCDCAVCKERTSGSYELSGRCMTCGIQFRVVSRKGDKPPLSVECPQCEVRQFSWRDYSDLTPSLPDRHSLAQALPEHRYCTDHIRGHESCLAVADTILRNLEGGK